MKLIRATELGTGKVAEWLIFGRLFDTDKVTFGLLRRFTFRWLLGQSFSFRVSFLLFAFAFSFCSKSETDNLNLAPKLMVFSRTTSRAVRMWQACDPFVTLCLGLHAKSPEMWLHFEVFFVCQPKKKSIISSLFGEMSSKKQNNQNGGNQVSHRWSWFMSNLAAFNKPLIDVCCCCAFCAGFTH